MRKMLCILFVFTCCLSLSGGGTHRAQDTARAVALSVDRASAEQWLCERLANSDLNLPRIPGALSAPQTLGAWSRFGHADPVRTAVRSVSAQGAAGAVKTTSPLVSTRSVAVTQAVDYYVYRLRRLII